MTISKRIGTSWTTSAASNRLILLLASVFGLGYGGRIGQWAASLGGFLLWLLTRHLMTGTQAVVLVLYALLVIGITERAERIQRRRDPEGIALNATVGVWLGFFMIWHLNPGLFLVGVGLPFALSRSSLFPLTVLEVLPGGVGMVAKSAAAGMITNLVLRLLLLWTA